MIRIIENLLILYYLAYFLIDWIFIVIFIRFVKKENLNVADNLEFSLFPVSIIVPAFNEEVTICESVMMLLALDYPDFEVIVVNDGSKDETSSVLERQYPFEEINLENRELIHTKAITSIKRYQNLILIDKENGGKADSINVGINFSTKKMICTIDADSVLDISALKQTVQPFINDNSVFVSGGQLAVANEVELRKNTVVSSRLPKNIWVQWQIIEYLKSFMIARYSMSKLNSVLIMSGAFSVYKKDDLINVGGFLTQQNRSSYITKIGGFGEQTVCEDMEVVVRLWRYFYERRVKARAVFLPHPVCWTEVPDNADFLKRQRNRWHRGLAETIRIHKEMIFEPKYKSIGLFAFPYYLLFELFSPIIKVFTVIFLVYATINGYFNQSWMLLVIIFTTLTSAIITSIATVLVEQWTLKNKLKSKEALRYKSINDWLTLILISILGDFIYSPFRIFAQLTGLIDFIKKKNNWYKFSRKGFGKQEEQ
ncbi:MAG: glycosyltransferase [Candidatus Cloacimonetes bacterium]|nr:glycosyltransferase [Candidatus Cloacimonadota bacterium]